MKTEPIKKLWSSLKTKWNNRKTLPPFKRGELVTVDHWVGRYDRSWVGYVLRVRHVENGFVFVDERNWDGHWEPRKIGLKYGTDVVLTKLSNEAL